MRFYRLFLIFLSISFFLYNCSNDDDEVVETTQFECKVDTISFLSDSTKIISDEVEVVFAVSLEGETKYFLLFALTGFFALPDLINVFTGQPTAPLPVILMGLVTLGLFYFGSKKGTI